MSRKRRDRDLGMSSNITRRDFLNGVGITVGSSLLSSNPFLLNVFGVPDSAFAPEKDPNYTGEIPLEQVRTAFSSMELENMVNGGSVLAVA